MLSQSGDQNTMLLGIELVCRESKGKSTAASILGFVANSDARCAHWPGDFQSQTDKSEHRGIWTL